MKIATWNINGIKARQATLVAWLAQSAPDIVCLQEVKSLAEAVDRAPFEALGYNVEIVGQKGFNGVALLSKRRIEDVVVQLPGDERDPQARYLEATVSAGDEAMRVASLYAPNGNPISGDKFAYKIDWMRRLYAHAQTRFADEDLFVLAGDYNVIPTPLDARHCDAWRDDALFQPQSRDAFAALTTLGFADAVRLVDDRSDIYTFWDYQAGAWQKNNGIRIDHLLLSPEAQDRLVGAGVERHVRAWEKPSDHVPVWIEVDVG